MLRNSQQQNGQTLQFFMYLFQALLLKNYPLLDIQFVGKQPEKGQTKKYGEAWQEKATN